MPFGLMDQLRASRARAFRVSNGPGQSLRLVLALAALGAMLQACSGRQAGSPGGLELSRLFPFARPGFAVCANANAGDIRFRAHLGTGLRPELEGPRAFSESDDTVEVLRFFLYEKRPVRIEIAAHPHKARRDRQVTFHLGAASLPAQLGHKIILPFTAADVSPGLNLLRVSGAKDVAWTHFAVYPSEAVDSSVGGVPLKPHLSPDRKEIYLPFGETLDFPLQCEGQMELTLEVAPWVELGAPDLQGERLQLDVVLRQQGSGPESQPTLSGSGAKRLKLAAAPGPVALQLSATSSTGPPLLPGQMGLRLTGARVHGASFPLTAIPQSAPNSVTSGPLSSPTPAALAPSPTPARAPNVVLYMVDTLRADRLSVYGYRHPTSPQLEKLATDAVVFEQVTAQSPWTKPSVASVLTGLEPSQHGVHDFGDVLHSGLTTWAEMLHLQGFETFALVANGLVGKKFGFDQGFAHHETMPVTTPASQLSELAIAQLAKRDKSRPFFLYLQPFDPHLPYAPPSGWRDQSAAWHGLKTSRPEDYPELGSLELESFGKIMFGLYCCAASGLDPELSPETLAYIRSLYDGEVAFVDDNFGRLVDWLKAEGLYDDTLIVFTSDHGEELVERGWLGHLHGLHEELVHVPLLIKWPRSQHAGKRVTETYQHIDILPTVLRALGLRPQLDAEGFPHSVAAAAYFELKAGADAQEMGQASTDFAEIGAGVREGDWKLTHYDASLRPVDLRALYNLKSDKAEKDNLILKDPVKALFLEAELARHRARPSRFVSSKVLDAETTNLLRSLDYLR